MNKKFTKLMAALALLTFLAVPMGMWGQTRDEVVSYTLEPASGTNNSYTGNCDITISNITWNLEGNSQQIPWRIGGKSLTGVDRNLYSKTAISDNISKIEVTHRDASSITVNSWTVIIASDASFNTVVSTLTPTFVANATTTITRPDGADWSDCYYKFIYNVSVSGTSNKFLEFSQAKFYKEENAGPVTTPTTVTIDASGITNTDFYQGTSAGTLTATVKDNDNNTITGATVTWTSSDTNVATIASNGAVTLVAAGTTTITASYAGDETYSASSASYQLEVINTTPYIIIESDEFSVTANEETGYLGIEYGYLEITQASDFDIQFCDAEGTALAEGTEPYWIGVDVTTQEGEEGYFVYYLIEANTGDERTAYFKVWALGEDEEIFSNLVVITQEEFVPDYATLPFEWAGGSSSDFRALTGVTTDGLGSDYASGNSPYLIKFDGTGDYIQVKTDSQPDIVTIKVKMLGGGNTSSITVQGSANGETFTNIEQLTISGSQNDVLTLESSNAFAPTDRYVRLYFTKGSNVGVGPITITKASAAVPYVSLSDNEIEATAEGGDGEIEITYGNISEIISFDYYFCDAQGNELQENPNWITAEIQETNDEYSLYYVIGANAGAARTAYAKVYTYDDELEMVYSIVTFSQAEYVAPPIPTTWVQTTLDQLTSEDAFLIVGANGYGYYALPNDGGTSDAPTAVSVTVDDITHTITGIIGEELQWNYSGNAINGYTFYPNGDDEKWLFCNTTSVSGNNNNMRVGTGNRKVFILDEDGYLVTNDDYVDRYLSIYVDNNDIVQDWRGYINTNSAVAISFYKKVVYPLTINGYGSSTTGGWNLIASPVSTTPDQVTNMLTDETTAPYSYDLYRFNQAAESEWENYHQHSGDFNIVPGTGYLYANKGDVNNTPNTVTLTFTGVPYDGDGEIELVYSTANPDSKMHGWNLIGNPFNSNVTIGERDFYIMNDNHDQIILADADHKIIAPMQGIFVKAENVNETVTFTRQNANANNSTPALTMNLIKNRGNVIDRAIVRFGQGRQLSKFQLFENSTKLYFAQNSEEMAVVRSEAQGEMPVNFRANENGQYTLTINPENVDMNYLHLIDNMTGADIDLLQTPSYTYNANVTDYESRFRLVFAANNNNEVGPSTGSGTFAFYSNGNWIINNVGEATLQVVDVNGRILSSETVNGSVSTTINATPGVYMIRLINGNDVKTQKIVVR